MLYTVEEASIQLKVSKQTIYSKIKQPKFKELLVFNQGKSMLTDELLKLIDDGLIINKDLNLNTHNKDEKSESTIADENIKDLINSFTKQLEAKDMQINNLNDRLKNEQELNRNNQELLIKPQEDLKQLEEHFQELDDKIKDIRERKYSKEGFISKLFKK